MAERAPRTWWSALPLLLVWTAAAYGGVAPSPAEGEPHPAGIPIAPLPADTPSAAAPNPRIGERLFGETGCNGCHTVGGIGGAVGPDLSGVGARPSRDPSRWTTTDAYIRASILDPGAYVVDRYQPAMPDAATLDLGEEEVEHLVAYLKTLRDGGGGS